MGKMRPVSWPTWTFGRPRSARRGKARIIADSSTRHNSNTLKLQGLFGARGAIKVRDL